MLAQCGPEAGLAAIPTRYVGPGGDVLTGYNATTGLPTITASGNWANLGYIAPHPFETGTTNALTFYNTAGVKGNLPRADRLRPARARRATVAGEEAHEVVRPSPLIPRTTEIDVS